MSSVLPVVGLMLIISLVACVSDLRTGLIPNWLTFPALILGPGIAAAHSGVPGLCSALVGILIAGGIALALYCLGGLGGGDVKLFAALAGLSGPRLGLEIELFALSSALLWGCVALMRWKKLPPRELGFVRLGGAIFAGTLLALVKQFW